MAALVFVLLRSSTLQLVDWAPRVALLHIHTVTDRPFLYACANAGGPVVARAHAGGQRT